MRSFLLVIAILFVAISFAQTPAEFYKKADEFYEKEDYQNALTQINKALVSDSLNLDYLLTKANSLLRLKDYKASFNVFSKAIYYHPTSAVALNQRGLLLQTIQEFEYAIQDYNTALTISNIDSIKLSLYINRGASKIGIREFQGAYDDFTLAYKIDSLNIGVLNNLATVCDEVGRGKETLKYLFKILAIDSSFIGTYVNIGFKYQEDGDHKKAIEYFTKAISMDPEEPLAYSNRSFNYLKTGDLKAALADVDKSIQLYPANSFAFKNRALIYIALKKIDKACADLDEAISLGFTKMYGREVEDLKYKHCKSKSG
jgi:tetratricopeptide (TPR) repeat protein